MTVPAGPRVDSELSPPTRGRPRPEGTASTDAAMPRSHSRRSEGRPATVRVGCLFDHSPVISPRANRIRAGVTAAAAAEAPERSTSSRRRLAQSLASSHAGHQMSWPQGRLLHRSFRDVRCRWVGAFGYEFERRSLVCDHAQRRRARATRRGPACAQVGFVGATGSVIAGHRAPDQSQCRPT